MPDCAHQLVNHKLVNVFVVAIVAVIYGLPILLHLNTRDHIWLGGWQAKLYEPNTHYCTDRNLCQTLLIVADCWIANFDIYVNSDFWYVLLL